MGVGIWKKIKNGFHKAGKWIKNAAHKVGTVFKEKIIPGAGKLIHTVANAAPGVIKAVEGIAGQNSKVGQFAEKIGAGVQKINAGYDKYAPMANKIAIGMAGI